MAETPEVEAVMRVLAGHQHRYSFDGSVDGDVLVVCQCGHQAGIEWVGEEAHKIHVAREVVAALDPVMRQARLMGKRSAWDEGYIAACTDHGGYKPCGTPDSHGHSKVNPYRIEADRG